MCILCTYILYSVYLHQTYTYITFTIPGHSVWGINFCSSKFNFFLHNFIKKYKRHVRRPISAKEIYIPKCWSYHQKGACLHPLLIYKVWVQLNKCNLIAWINMLPDDKSVAGYDNTFDSIYGKVVWHVPEKVGPKHCEILCLRI